MHGTHNTCQKCMHTLRKKCIRTRACAPMQRCRSFFAMEVIANFSWVLREHRAECRLPPALAAPPAVSTKHVARRCSLKKSIQIHASSWLWCRTSMIRLSVLVQASSSLSPGRTCASLHPEFYFRFFFAWVSIHLRIFADTTWEREKGQRKRVPVRDLRGCKWWFRSKLPAGNVGHLQLPPCVIFQGIERIYPTQNKTEPSLGVSWWQDKLGYLQYLDHVCGNRVWGKGHSHLLTTVCLVSLVWLVEGFPRIQKYAKLLQRNEFEKVVVPATKSRAISHPR